MLGKKINAFGLMTVIGNLTFPAQIAPVRVPAGSLESAVKTIFAVPHGGLSVAGLAEPRRPAGKSNVI